MPSITYIDYEGTPRTVEGEIGSTIMETAIIFFAGQALETAVADSSRLIMTGQAQNASYTASSFKTAVWVAKSV